MICEDLFADPKDVLSNFSAPEDALDGAILHAAVYHYEDYSGSACVLFEKDGKPFLVHGGHCSCYGLEGQWEPEETDWPTVLHFLENGTEFYEFSDAAQNYIRNIATEKAKQ